MVVGSWIVSLPQASSPSKTGHRPIKNEVSKKEGEASRPGLNFALLFQMKNAMKE
jgi:hypothetical protein